MLRDFDQLSFYTNSMKNNFFLIQQTDDLLHSVPVRDYFSQKIIASESPFLPVSSSARIKMAFMNGWFWIAEKLLGSKLYVENDLRELFFVDSRIRSLLLSLVEKKFVFSWERVLMLPDLPNFTSYWIKLQPHKLPSGRYFYPQGNGGNGTGHTVHEALIPALAEALERQSLCVWDPKKIIRGSFENLRHRGAVYPSLFTSFSEKQLATNGFVRSLVASNTEMGFIPTRSLISGKKHLIPAQLVYISYTEEYPNEPYFLSSTTNGSAAGVSFDDATYRAICEAVERDGLFIFWLNKIAPPMIDLESIPYQKVREQLNDLEKYGLEFFILDITTDLEIPAFCSVLLDRSGKVAVSMSAVAGFDIEKSLEKLIFETLKYPHNIVREDTPSTFEAVQKKYLNIRTFDERRSLWAKKEMISQIEFFLQGRKKGFSEINVEYAGKDIATRLDKIKNILKKRAYNCFLVDVTSQEARHAGLRVVKAVIPQLMPIYFSENEKPLGIKRLYTLPVTLGYRTAPLNENELNPIPHPFI